MTKSEKLKLFSRESRKPGNFVSIKEIEFTDLLMRKVISPDSSARAAYHFTRIS